MLFLHIVDYPTSKLLIKNASNKALCIPRYHKFGHLIDIAYNYCFLTDTKSSINVAILLSLSY